MKQTPLYEQHHSQGAAFGEEAGWTVPLHYGDMAAEVRASLPPLKEYHCLTATVGNGPLIIARNDFTGEEGYALFAPASETPDLGSALLSAGEAHRLRPVGLEALDVLRVEAGVPRYGVDMDDTTIPLEARLDHAISTTKGCYLGQEYIARILAQGHCNRFLTGFRGQGNTPPPRGSRIFVEGKDVGWITSAAVSPTVGGFLALGYLRCEYTEPGTEVSVPMEGSIVSAKVAAPNA